MEDSAPALNLIHGPRLTPRLACSQRSSGKMNAGAANSSAATSTLAMKRFLAMAVSASLVVPASAWAKNEPSISLEKVGKWEVNYDDDSCHLMAEFGRFDNTWSGNKKEPVVGAKIGYTIAHGVKYSRMSRKGK